MPTRPAQDFALTCSPTNFKTGNNAGLWKEVMDKINSGQMPPKKKAAAGSEGGI